MTATFEFELDPLFPFPSVNTSNAFDVLLAWRQVGGNRTRSGVVRSAQLERVEQTETYRLSVPLRLLGDGRLLVDLTLGISCLDCFYYRCSCFTWVFRATSDPLEISAKRGE